MSLHVAGHNGTYLHAIIKEGHTALSIDLHLGYIFTPCHPWKGSGFKKGVCVHCSMPWVLPPGALLAWLLSSEGPGLSSLVPYPPCGLDGNSFSMLLPRGSHR